MFFWEQLKSLRSRFIQPIISHLNNIQSNQNKLEKHLEKRLESIQRTLGRIESRQLDNKDASNLNDYEFQVFSQWGEDGIIQFLVKNIEIDKKIFVEFGVEDYTEANTRFLLINNNWSGLIIDASEDNILQIKQNEIYWNYNLKAVCSFITKDNINNLLLQNGIKGEIGILSIDIDGNDYWIWDTIDIISPVIVIVEYNHRFGLEKTVAIPYHKNFERSKSHHSMIYFGASLKALCILAKRKGYVFVGCNSNGVNAFFIRQDKKPDLIQELSPEEGYYEGKFCEVRNQEGIQTKISLEEEARLFNKLNLPVVNIE